MPLNVSFQLSGNSSISDQVFNGEIILTRSIKQYLRFLVLCLRTSILLLTQWPLQKIVNINNKIG